MHSVGHPPHAGPANRVAQLVRDFVHGEPLPTERQHLRHERQVLQLTPLIEGGEDLISAAHLDEISNLEAQHRGPRADFGLCHCPFTPSKVPRRAKRPQQCEITSNGKPARLAICARLCSPSDRRTSFSV